MPRTAQWMFTTAMINLLSRKVKATELNQKNLSLFYTSLVQNFMTFLNVKCLEMNETCFFNLANSFKGFITEFPFSSFVKRELSLIPLYEPKCKQMLLKYSEPFVMKPSFLSDPQVQLFRWWYLKAESDQDRVDKCILGVKSLSPKEMEALEKETSVMPVKEDHEIKDKINADNEPKPQSPRKKQKIPAAVRHVVWAKYIGADTAESKCFCCQVHHISQTNFECGHIQAEAEGGATTIENLRPVCSLCNKSMGKMNMRKFIEKFGIPKHPSL